VISISRTADYTIQGFLYQFHKTLLEIQSKPSEEFVSIEGIIEDVEVFTAGRTEAIQCKYHESIEKFTLSQVYKPIIQMMEHWYNSGNKDNGVTYILYAYFPHMFGEEINLTTEDIEEILSTKNKKLSIKAANLKGKVNIKEFLENFKFEFGHSMDDLKKVIISNFLDLGFKEEYVDNLIYPNAINFIAETSTLHSEKERTINIGEFLQCLQKIKNTALSKWTLSLRSFRSIIQTRKKQLNVNLQQNSRLRYFIIKEEFIEDFDQNIVTFIKEYLDKYHFKIVHDRTPLFCLDCSDHKFNEILVRLHQKNIKANHGLVASDCFDEAYFFGNPITNYKKSQIISREFEIRMLHIKRHEILNRYKADDLFILSDNDYFLNSTDVNYEKIELRDFNAIKFVLGMRDSYE
jgi:hypothetical protein